MYEHILVPIDGSALAERVLPYATRIAERLGLPLTLVRVAETEEEQRHAGAELDRLVATLTTVTAHARVIPAAGSVSETLLAAAGDPAETLIAITSHGRGGLGEALLGSVAHEIVLAGDRPVLVYHQDDDTPPTEEMLDLRTVLLPLDGTPTSEAMMDVAAEWAKALDARLYVVQVLDDATKQPATPGDVMENSYVRARAERLGREYGVAADWEVLRGDPAEAIIRELAGLPGTLVAMATRGRHGLRAALLGSVTGEVLRNGGAPIITCKP